MFATRALRHTLYAGRAALLTDVQPTMLTSFESIHRLRTLAERVLFLDVFLLPGLTTKADARPKETQAKVTGFAPVFVDAISCSATGGREKLGWISHKTGVR